MPVTYLSGLIRRCLIVSVVGCGLSLGFVGFGLALAEYRGVLIEKENHAKSLARSVSDEQIKLGLKVPINECVDDRMADWAPSGRFLSRRDARSRAQQYCGLPFYLSDEYLREETPLAFQDLWFAYLTASESAKSPRALTKMFSYSGKFKRYGMFGVYLSLAFLCVVCLTKWIRDGNLPARK